MNNKYYLDIVFRKEKLSDGSDVFVSNCPSLGLASQGDNIEESLDMVKEAIQLYLEDIDNLEWDTYLLSIDDGSSGWDVAESCPFQPFDLSPGVSATTTLYLVSNSVHSLLVSVQDATGSAISGASIRLYRTGYDETQTGSSCGQTFFDSLLTGTYTIEISASGYQSTTVPDVSVVGDVSLVVNLESL